MSSDDSQYVLVYINDPVDEDSEGVEQVFLFRNSAEAEDWSEGVNAIKTVHQYFHYCLDTHSVGYCKAVAKDYVRMTFHFGIKWDFEVPQDVMRQYQRIVAWIEQARARERAAARGD